jgi:hypothetical protein
VVVKVNEQNTGICSAVLPPACRTKLEFRDSNRAFKNWAKLILFRTETNQITVRKELTTFKVRCKVLTTAIVKITAFLDIEPCLLVEAGRHFIDNRSPW